MILVSFPCDEYIDQPKLTEQKNPFEYIVPPPPPPRGVGTTMRRHSNLGQIVQKVLEPEVFFH